MLISIECLLTILIKRILSWMKLGVQNCTIAQLSQIFGCIFLHFDITCMLVSIVISSTKSWLALRSSKESRSRLPNLKLSSRCFETICLSVSAIVCETFPLVWCFDSFLTFYKNSEVETCITEVANVYDKFDFEV